MLRRLYSEKVASLLSNYTRAVLQTLNHMWNRHVPIVVQFHENLCVKASLEIL